MSKLSEAIRKDAEEKGIELKVRVIEPNPLAHKEVTEFLEKLKYISKITKENNIKFGYQTLTNFY